MKLKHTRKVVPSGVPSLNGWFVIVFSRSLDEFPLLRFGLNANYANWANAAKINRKFAFFVPFAAFALSISRP